MRTLALPYAFVATLAWGTLFADLSALVDPGATARKVAGDCAFTEGPAWSPEGFLLFSDIPNERIVRVDAEGGVSDFLKPSGRANGLMFDREGALYACQGGARRIVWIDVATRKITVLSDSYDGKKLNSPNDLALDAHGGIYFTDPRYGSTDGMEQPVMGVYYIDRAGKTSRIIEDLERPNGILVSPGGEFLYVAEPNQRALYRYEIAAPGKIEGKKRIFTGDGSLDGGGPDGMAHDVHGNVYATYSGIVVLDPEGEVIGRIPVPERPANCAFGGKDAKTLFITARTSLYAIDTKVAGMALQPGRAREPTRTVRAGALRLEVPESWKEGKPSSRMRVAELEIPAAEGGGEPAELVVFYFGEGQGGGAGANIKRWIAQFAPDGRTFAVRKGDSSQGRYTLVDVKGTYNKPVGPPVLGRTESAPGSRMLAAILSTDEGNYFLKLTGPEATVAAAGTAFRRAFGADPATEKAAANDAPEGDD